MRRSPLELGKTCLCVTDCQQVMAKRSLYGLEQASPGTAVPGMGICSQEEESVGQIVDTKCAPVMLSGDYLFIF
jgi:hypothetical protein